MSSEVMKELHENADHAKHDPSMAPVTLTMAVLAVFVAAVSLLGHRVHTEEVVLQDKITDGWAYYQAKNIRRNTDQMFVDLASIVPATDSKLASKLRAQYEAETKRYSADQKKIEAATRKLESETAHEKKRADFYDLGEVLVEIALVVTSITLLSKQRIFWLSGLIIGAAGLVVTAIGMLAL
jgi:Domain of unknown function (DUF4337)